MEECDVDITINNDDIIFIHPKRKTLVAPWKNVEEFIEVYTWIYGAKATNETKKLACDQMKVWKIRRLNLTPAAVLGTLVILEIQLKDVQYGPSATIEQLKDLQIFYSSAFTRFFNYMSSIMQTDNLKSMYDTAKELNLRSFVVDLRHICAHGQSMPSIEILRSTSKYCVRWLEEFFWKPQSESMQNVDTKNIRRKDHTKFEDKVTQLFGFYDSALECVLNEEQKISKKYVKGKKYLEMNTYVDKKGVADVNTLLGEIVKDLGTLIRQERNLADLPDIYVEAILKMRFFFDLVEKHTGTDEQLEVLIFHTVGMFRMLAIYGLIEDLFHSFLAIVENKNQEPARRTAAGFWANQLVLGFIAFRRCKEAYKLEREQNPSKIFDLASLNFDNTSKKVLRLYSRVGINVKRTLIFGDTVRRPWVWTFDRTFVEERLIYANEFSVEILKNILYLVDPQLTDAEIATLKELFDLSVNNDLAEYAPGVYFMEENDADRLYTTEDVMKYLGAAGQDEAMQEVPEGKTESGAEKYGVWSTVPECQDWYACPIGKLLWD